MAARREGGEVGGSVGKKPKEKVESGEDQVWLGLEAKREEPGGIVAAQMGLVWNRRRQKRGKSRRWDFLIAILGGCSVEEGSSSLVSSRRKRGKGRL